MVQKRANIEFFYAKQSGYWLDIGDLDVIKLKVKTGHSMMVQTELMTDGSWYCLRLHLQ